MAITQLPTKANIKEKETCKFIVIKGHTQCPKPLDLSNHSQYNFVVSFNSVESMTF